METIYKGKKIQFNESTAKFFIQGGSKEFASLGRAKKEIDKAIPDKPFVPFKVLRHSGKYVERKYISGWEVVDITAARFVKARSKYDDDEIRYTVGSGKKARYSYGYDRDEISNSRHSHVYKEVDLEALKALDARHDALQKQIDALEDEQREISNKKEEFEVNIDFVCEQAGNVLPTAEL